MDLITDNEAEQRVISAMLHSETACAEALATIDAGEFYHPMHREVFSLIKSLYKRGVRPTLAEVFKEGMSSGLIKNLQDGEELRHISGQYIDEANITYWITGIKKAAKGRKAQRLLRQYTNEMQKSTLDIDRFIQQAGSDFMALAMDAESERIETGADIATYGKQQLATNVETWRKAQEDAKFRGEIPLEGAATGLKTLDNLTLGYKPGDLILLGAQTGHGKTAFALNTVNAVCIVNNQRLLYVNTEMSKKQVAYRLGSIISQIQMQKIRSGALTNGELAQVDACFDILAESNFTVCNIPNLTPDKLQTMAQRAKLQHDIQLLILDYVGRMDKRDLHLQEWQVLEDVIKACKLMAQNLEIAVMVLVQLNADGTLQGAKRMENECDLMLQLLPLGDEDNMAERRERFEKKYGATYEPAFNYYLRINKSRDSESGISIPLVFDKARQQIREAKKT